jgi:hypothetical protein
MGTTLEDDRECGCRKGGRYASFDGIDCAVMRAPRR